MHDSAITVASLRDLIRRIDFLNYPELRSPDEMQRQVVSAIEFLESPLTHAPWIVYSTLRGKKVARAGNYGAALAVRKLERNCRIATRVAADGREAVVLALRAILTEGVPFRLYRLDIHSFYESFQHDHVETLLRVGEMPNATRRALQDLLAIHARASGSGLPRGLSISSVLAQALMRDFDRAIRAHSDVFFYRRYVDDMILVTSGREEKAAFLKTLDTDVKLPPGLKLKRKTKKQTVLDVNHFVPLHKPPSTTAAANVTSYLTFEYLGYQFNVAKENHPFSDIGLRNVWIDIAPSKVAKLKTRLVRSFLSYLKSGDFPLLESRVRHLTSNMSLMDRSRGVKRMIGIHFNYPLVDLRKSRALRDLDSFLLSALGSGKGRVFGMLRAALSTTERLALARYSFYAGAAGRHFYQLSVRNLAHVQSCWKYG